MVAYRVHDRLVVCPSRSLALEAGPGRAGVNGGVGPDLAVDTGRWLAVGGSTAWPIRIGRSTRRIAYREGAKMCREVPPAKPRLGALPSSDDCGSKVERTATLHLLWRVAWRGCGWCYVEMDSAVVLL